jgi:sigma-B regulation protein RsbU (phosphoserine phosphatase)
MSLDFLATYVSSPLTAKLLVLGAALALVLFCRRRELENVSSAFIGLIALFALRDILFEVFALEEIFFVSEVLGFGIAFFALSWFSGRKLNAILAAALNLAFLVAFAANLAFSFFPWIDARLLMIALGADLVWLTVSATIGFKKGDTIGERLAGGTWIYYVAASAVVAVSAVFLGYGNEWVQRLAVPAGYSALFVFGFTHLSIIEQQGQREREYLTHTIDSIYAFMERSGEAFKSAANMDQLLALILKSMMDETKASGGVIGMIDEFDDLLAIKAYEGSFAPCFKLPQELPKKPARVEAFMKHAQFKLGETILGEVAKTGQPVLIDDPLRDSRVFVNGEEEFLSYSSLIVVPFSLGERVIGVMGVSRKAQEAAFGEYEYERSRMLADFGAIVIRNLQSAVEAAEKSTIEKEAGIAHDIQRILLPKKMVEIGRLSFGAFSSPARGVYSDYYDIIQTRRDRMTAVMVDVAGKGVQASLIMVMVRAILHLITNTTKDMGTMLSWINRGITGKIEVDHFATVGIVSADIESGDVEYSSANQQPIIVVRKGKGAVEVVEMKSVPIGVERKTEYGTRKLRLGPDDILALYTDGIVEAMNVQGKQYGRKRLGELLSKLSGMVAKDIALAVRQDLQEFMGQARQHDDQSLLIMKMKA